MNIRPAEARDVVGVGALAEEAELFPAEMAAELLGPSLEQKDCEDVWLVAEAAMVFSKAPDMAS